MRRTRLGWVLPRAGSWVLLALMAIASPGQATEPDGHVRLQVERLSESAAGLPVVRLSLHSLAPVDQATLTVRAPLDVDARPVPAAIGAGFEELPTVSGRQAMRSALRSLGAAAVTIDFELNLAPQSGGIVEFIVEARDANGRPIRNALGIFVGQPKTSGVRRLGAHEFPAAVLGKDAR